jgi:phosphomannomutase
MTLCKDVGVGELSGIFKAYDVRGVVPDQLDEQVAHDIGAAFADELAADAGTDGAVAVGYDMRPSSPGLATAFADGLRDRGRDVVMIGLASTDMVYFASGWLGVAGAMFTASHNPAQYNGIKLCRPGAVALSAQTGLSAIRDRVLAGVPKVGAEPRGTLEERSLLSAYASYLHGLVAVSGRRLKVVVDAGNAMAGLTAPAVLGPLDLDLRPLFFELDGTFPNHEANPLVAANLVDLQAAVVREGADLGLAFDGDADRCFVVDEAGQVISPSALTALIAVRALAAEPGAHVIHNLITSKVVPELIVRHGGIPVRTKVGHSLIKATMASTHAVFGGEHSGHFYFRDFWYADSGMLAALHLLAALAASEDPVSRLVADYDPYCASGEINTEVSDVPSVLDAISTAFRSDSGVELDHLDGLTATGQGWWFNVRPSNTEPVVRLNVEADDASTMTRIRDEVLSLIGGRRA